MITLETDRLVDDYLRRLEAAAAHLQRSRRAELVAEIREHIEAALLQEEAANETTVRNVLERLGPPEEIVEAAEPPPSEPASAPPTQLGKLEIGALIALLVPFLGWVVGIVLVVVSRAWSGREKALGIALLLLPVLLPAVGFALMSGGSDSSPVPVEPADEGLPSAGTKTVDTVDNVISSVVLLVLAGLPSAVYLGWRLRRSQDSAATGA